MIDWLRDFFSLPMRYPSMAEMWSWMEKAREEEKKMDSSIKEERARIDRLVQSFAASASRQVMDLFAEEFPSWRRQYIIDSVEYYSKLKRDKEQQMSESSDKPVNLPDMPLYQCYKRVRAAKIVNIIAILHWNYFILDYGSNCNIHRIDLAFLQKHNPEVGGYFVVYDDGYQSYSPAKAFEEGYIRIENIITTAKINVVSLNQLSTPVQKPSIGRIVHYRIFDINHGCDICYPAIVQCVMASGKLRLGVFRPDIVEFITPVEHGTDQCIGVIGDRNTWHWPEIK